MCAIIYAIVIVTIFYEPLLNFYNNKIQIGTMFSGNER